MKTVIEMAREAGFHMPQGESFYEAWPESIERFAELVRADERKSRAHSLGPGQMELSLRRVYKDELFECRRRFSAEEVIHGPDWLVEATAYNLEVEIDRHIRAYDRYEGDNT
jgi:hypothetical protein